MVYLLGPHGTDKAYLATGLGVEAVKAGKSVYIGTLAEIIAWLEMSYSTPIAQSSLLGACDIVFRFQQVYCK